MFNLIPFEFLNIGMKVETVFNEVLKGLFSDNFITNINLESILNTAIKETPEGYIICIKFKGINRRDIKITYKDKVLTISAIKKININNGKNSFIRLTNNYNNLIKQFYIADGNIKKMRGIFKEELLVLVIPRKRKIIKSEQKVLIK